MADQASPPEQPTDAVELGNATPEQIERANAAVEANLIDGSPRWDSAQGYACALTAIMQTDAALPTPQTDIAMLVQSAIDEIVRLEGERENGPFVFSYAAVEQGIRTALSAIKEPRP